MNQKPKNELERLALDLDKAARAASVETNMLGVAHTLTPDEPIKSSQDDQLNRAGFARELARAVLAFDRTESFVIGIYGRWGTGKTSLLNLIVEQLQETSQEAPIIFLFNAWAFSDQDQLVAQFFGGLAEFLRLHNTIPLLSGVADTVEQYGKLVSPITRMLFPRATEAVSTGWAIFRKIKPANRGTLPELKAQINGALRNSASKLVIILDDIDRLNAFEIRQVFQLIKLNANFSNTVYLVAFDREPVEKALKDVAPGPPNEYLEKIIQVTFNLPPINNLTLTEIIFNKFNEIIVGTGITLDTQRFGNMFHSGFRANFKTLRDVNRYFNLLRFTFNVLRKDTNFIDLAALQSLALFHPDIYMAIQHNPELFSGIWLDRESVDENAIRTKYETIFKTVPDSDREAVISLCSFLFPKMEAVYGTLKSWYGFEWEQPWRKSKRIAASKYFPYYFQLAVPDTEVSQAEFDNAIEAAESVDAFVEKLRVFKQSKRFAAFVDLLRDSLDSLNRKRQLIVLGSVFVFGDEASTERIDVFGTVSEHVRFGSWLVFDILDRLPEGRFDTLVALMRGQPAVFTIVRLTFLFEQAVVSNQQGADRLRGKYPDLTEKIVAEMKGVAVEAIARAVLERRLQQAPSLPFLLYRWKQWGESNAVSSWIQSTFLSTPKGATSFVSHFTQPVSSFGLDDKVGRVRIEVSLKAINDFADLELLRQLVQAASDGELTDEEQLAKTRFLSAMAKLDAGGSLESQSFPWESDEDKNPETENDEKTTNLVIEVLSGQYVIYTYERPQGGSPMVDIFLHLRVHNRGDRPTDIYCDRLRLDTDSGSEAFAMGEFYTSQLSESTKFFRLMAASSEELNLYGRRHDSHPPSSLLSEQPAIVRAIIKDTYGAVIKVEEEIKGRKIVNQ